jgi:hypothetical protein
MEPDLREECCVSVSVTVEVVSADPLFVLGLGMHSASPASSQLTGGVLLQYKMQALSMCYLQFITRE